MSNMIFGITLIIINVILVIATSLTWWGVIGVASGSALFGFGLREFEAQS